MKQIILGLTGPTGAGKSTLAKALRALGFAVVDADKAARKVTRAGSPVLLDLARRFGEDILFSCGSLNRTLLADRAFSSPESARALNQITHPAIIRLISDEIQALAEAGERLVLLDAPLLFESGADSVCDWTVSVLADENIRLARIMGRDGISEDEAKKRISAQPEEEFYRTKSDYIIQNDGNSEMLQREAERLFHTICGRMCE